MSVVIGVLNGTNENRDEQFQAICSATMTAGVRKGFKNALEVTTGQVNTGMAFVEVVRTSVTPNETFLIPVSVNAATAVSTAGTGWIIIKISQVKINDGSSNATDGTGVATIENVAVLPADPYLILATLSGGVITDARTYSQVQSNILDNVQDLITLNLNSVNWKEKVRVSTTGNITISTALNAGDVIDGVTLANGDRVGVFLQTDATQNGIYIVGSSPARSPDFDATAEITGARVPVGPEGTANANSNYLCTSTNPVIGVDDIDFVVYGSSTIIATQAEAEAAINDTKMMTPLKAKQSRQFTATAGENVDGSTTPQAVGISTYLENTISQATAGVGQDLGFSGNAEKVGQEIISYGGTLLRFSITLYKVGSPTDNVECRVYASDKTTLLATSATLHSGGSLSTTPATKEFVFNLNTGVRTVYFIEAKRSGVTNNTNYYKVACNATPTSYPYGAGFNYNVGAWGALSAAAGDLVFSATINTGIGTAGRYYKSQAGTFGEFSGFVKGNKTTGQTDQVICNDGEIVDGFTGLTTGADYFASSVTAGAITTTNTGIPVGRAISTTQLIVEKKEKNKYIAMTAITNVAGVTNFECGFKPNKASITHQAPTSTVYNYDAVASVSSVLIGYNNVDIKFTGRGIIWSQDSVNGAGAESVGMILYG